MNKESYDVSYLSIDSIQEGVGSSQILPLLFGFTKMGMRVSLISFEKKAPSADLLRRISSGKIDWLPQAFVRNGPWGGLQRFNSIRKTIPRASIIHGRSDIPTAAAVTSSLDAPILWDVRSLWADQRNLIGTTGWNTVTTRAARQLENISAKGATAMTTLTKAVIPILEKRHAHLPEIRAVIPTCVDTSRFTPSPMPVGRITCLLSGTFNNYYDLERTKEILNHIRASMDLRIIWARGEESSTMKLDVGEEIIITAKYAEMPKIVAQSHFGIAICKPEHGPSLTAAAPTKIGEFLASGRPVIVSQGIGDLDELLFEKKTGLVIGPYDSLEKISTQLMEILADSKTPDLCRSLALEKFDMGGAIDTYASVYSSVLRNF
jgi:hypothetical protein